VPDARGRRARRLGEHRITRVLPDVSLGGGWHRQGPSRGSRHARGRIVRTAHDLRAGPHGGGSAGRSRGRLEARNQAPVAARGGLQVRPVPRDGRAPRASSSRRRRPADRVAPADRGRTDVREPAVRARRHVHERRRLLHDDRCRRPSLRVRELQARVDELRVRGPDDGVAIGRQLAHRVSRASRRSTSSRVRPAETLSTCDESCSPTTHARCARWSSRPRSPTGARHQRKVTRAGSRAPASSATAPT
jgi:hypothetical protein